MGVGREILVFINVSLLGPLGTPLQSEMRSSRSPVKLPGGQILRSPRPKVTSVLTRSEWSHHAGPPGGYGRFRCSELRSQHIKDGLDLGEASDNKSCQKALQRFWYIYY